MQVTFSGEETYLHMMGQTRAHEPCTLLTLDAFFFPSPENSPENLKKSPEKFSGDFFQNLRRIPKLLGMLRPCHIPRPPKPSTHPSTHPKPGPRSRLKGEGRKTGRTVVSHRTATGQPTGPGGGVSAKKRVCAILFASRTKNTHVHLLRISEGKKWNKNYM